MLPICLQTTSLYRDIRSETYTSDILSSLDEGNVSLLCLLDLSAAFDSVDHAILVSRLNSSFGISGVTLQWVHSFLAERTQSVRYRAVTSPPADVTCGVPQGSVLGPLLFIVFTADLTGLVNGHGLSLLMYADDIQIYGSCHPSKKRELSEQVSSCLDSLICWFRSNRLLLNTDKSKFMWFASRQRLKYFSSDHVRISDQLLTPVTSMRCLGFYLDSDTTFGTHITKTVSSCYSILRQIRSVRRSLNRPLLTTLVSALVYSPAWIIASLSFRVPHTPS